MALVLGLLLVLAGVSPAQVLQENSSGVSGGSGITDLSGVFDVEGELINPEVTTGSFVFNGAGPPAAGSCPHNKATYRDTTNVGDTYVCYGEGQNWHLIGENDDNIAAIDTDIGDIVSASGPTNLNLTGTAPLTFVGNNTTKTISTIFTSEKCATLNNTDATDDNVLLGSFRVAVTITSVWCNYGGAAPTTSAVFALEDGLGNAMTHSAPTCSAPGTPATAVSVTAANALTARELIRVDVTNTPNPATDSYSLCVAYTIP
jgi:hypothetical protein